MRYEQDRWACAGRGRIVDQIERVSDAKPHLQARKLP